MDIPTKNPTPDTPMTAFTCPLAQAIDLLRHGFRLPVALTRELREQGYDIPSLHTAHLNKKA